MSRKRLELADERNTQALKRNREKRGAHLTNQIGNRKKVKMEETEVESPSAGSIQGVSRE